MGKKIEIDIKFLCREEIQRVFCKKKDLTEERMGRVVEPTV